MRRRAIRDSGRRVLRPRLGRDSSGSELLEEPRPLSAPNLSLSEIQSAKTSVGTGLD